VLIGRDKFKRKDWINGGGMGIHYLKNVKDEELSTDHNLFGYENDFDGIGVFINPTKSKKSDGRVRTVQVQALTN